MATPVAGVDEEVLATEVEAETNSPSVSDARTETDVRTQAGAQEQALAAVRPSIMISARITDGKKAKKFDVPDTVKYADLAREGCEILSQSQA